MNTHGLSFQEIILKLLAFWVGKGCVLLQPYDVEVGAGTFHPATFLRCLGPEPWRAVYIEPSRRPTDGRYGENPSRTGAYYQCQVLLKPPPDDPQGVYLESLAHLGVDLVGHDVRFVEDDWESPTLGASGLGWEVWLDGQEITQFTYFQQAGGLELDPISVEITYGLERIATFIQDVESFFDLVWTEGITYAELRREEEVQFSRYNFEHADVQMLVDLFSTFERECNRLVEAGLVLPAYDYVLKSSHTFNMLDARRAIGVTERTSYIARVRALARKVARAHLDERERMGFPLLRGLSVKAS